MLILRVLLTVALRSLVWCDEVILDCGSQSPYRYLKRLAKEMDVMVHHLPYSHRHVLITQDIHQLPPFPDVPECTLLSTSDLLIREKRRYRSPGSTVHFHDPEFKRQWHLVNVDSPGDDVHVAELWASGINGTGIRLCVIDDGIEWTNPDINDNFCRRCSYDLNDDDYDVMPRLDDQLANHHGTRCAGLIAAVTNEVCGVGAAYGAKIGGVRILDGQITDRLEAEAYHVGFHLNDIYSCSWGPLDDGSSIDGPHTLTEEAITYAANVGREGRGAVIVVASGNGAGYGDSCAYDGYASSIYTFTIGAVGEDGTMPYYSEGCASVLAVTYSGPGTTAGLANHIRDVVTTDWIMGGSGCTEHFAGTSASAPLAAGLFALALQARPCLLWRDLLWLVAITSRPTAESRSDEHAQNGAGFFHTNRHGFGIISATSLAKAALVWPGIPWMSILSSEVFQPNKKFTPYQPLTLQYEITKEHVGKYYVNCVEQVQVFIHILHPVRGNVQMVLTSPAGSHSVIAPPRPDDTNADINFKFSSLHFIGESPLGTWTVTIEDTEAADLNPGGGSVFSWRISVYGSYMSPDEVEGRISIIRAASNRSVASLLKEPRPTCSKPLVDFGHEGDVMSMDTMRSLAMIEFLVFFMALWVVVEDLLLEGEEDTEEEQESDCSCAEDAFKKLCSICTGHFTSYDQKSQMDQVREEIALDETTRLLQEE